MPSANAGRKTRNIVVRPSAVGLGVFARRDLPRGRTIGLVRGELITDPDYGSDYCVDLSDGFTLEPHAPFRYVNHSCQPNSEFVVSDVKNASGRLVGKTLRLVALRPIVAGEEITIDYAWPADAAIPCLCCSPRCRGWIVKPEELLALRASARAPERPRPDVNLTG